MMTEWQRGMTIRGVSRETIEWVMRLRAFVKGKTKHVAVRAL
jgi:hypothetical protein